MSATSVRSLLGMRNVMAVLARPDLWWTALRLVRTLARPGWLRRAPHLPLPDEDYLRFRLITAYGAKGEGPARAEDLVSYLEWCRSWPLVTRRGP